MVEQLIFRHEIRSINEDPIIHTKPLTDEFYDIKPMSERVKKIIYRTTPEFRKYDLLVATPKSTI
jgi:hypothetical protein